MVRGPLIFHDNSKMLNAGAAARVVPVRREGNLGQFHE
jgi:hypothetical protein